MERCFARVLMWAVILLVPALARADGKAFARAGFARAEIPEQRALIHWADGFETLVIETVVRGEGTNFAWVVPLPSVPEEVGPSSTALFPTLQNIFQARVESRRDGTGWFWLAGAGVLWALRGIGKLKGGPAEKVAAFLALVAAVVPSVLMLLPALAKAKGGAVVPRTSTVEVLGRTRAGVFDVTTLTARKPADLLEWLRGHGFDAPADLEPVVAEHLRDGWVFVAARAVRDTNSGDPFALHPLRFRFAAPAPVYPLRLTGAGGTKPVAIDLYVFGPARAEAEGFRVAYCGEAHHERFDGYREAPLLLRIRQPELSKLAAGARVGTKLSGHLEASAMRRDARIRWVRFRSEGQTVFTRQAARSQAGTWAGLFLFAGAVIGLWRQVFGPRSAPAFSRVHLAWGVAAGLVGLVAYAGMPRVEDADVVRVARGNWRNSLLELEAWGRDALEEARKGGTTLAAESGLAVIRAGLADAVTGTNPPAWSRNAFTGGPMREEASPGNYSLILSNRTVVLSWHDFDGAPVVRGMIDLEPATARPAR